MCIRDSVKAAREPAFKVALMDISQRGQILCLAYPEYWVDEAGEQILSADFEKLQRVLSDRLAPWGSGHVAAQAR